MRQSINGWCQRRWSMIQTPRLAQLKDGKVWPMSNSWTYRNRVSNSWLFTPPLKGFAAGLFSFFALVIPTTIRLSLHLRIDDEPHTLFSIFVLATVILCGWRYAVAVAIGTAIVCNTVMMGPPYGFHFTPAEMLGLGTCLGYSLFVIAVVQLFRETASRSLRQAGAKESASGIIFSVDEGQAWASWYGVDAPVRLGPKEEVAAMMEDFLAQVELSDRLKQHTPGRAPSNPEIE